MKFLKWLIPFLLLPSWAQADFGCHFILNSRLSIPLDSSVKKISFRFTCRQDLELIGVSFYCEQAQDPPEYKVSLEEDEKGAPSLIPLESSSVTPKGGCWATVPINNLSLLTGKVYHIVIEQDVTRGGQHPVGVINAQHFASVAYGDHLNPFDPRDEKPDPQLNILVMENGKWRVLDQQPLFALYGSGSKFQGVPYDSFGELPIHGNGTPNDPSDDVLSGEVLHPHSGLIPTGFALRVRKQGNPTAPLHYRVYTINFLQHKITLAFSGLAVSPPQVKEDYQWVTIGVKKEDQPQEFPAECRYVAFQTDSGRASDQAPGCEDCYLISEIGNSGGLADAADLSFDGGAHLSREAVSSDGGATWQDAFERDANVVILGTLAPAPKPQTQNPIPTPVPWFQEFAP
jgi:hypothetical protein